MSSERSTISKPCCWRSSWTARAGVSAGNSEIYITVTGVDVCYQRAVDAGAKVLAPIADRAYGMRDFAIQDPDGNRISLGEELAKR